MRNQFNKINEEKENVSTNLPKSRQRVRPTLFVIFAREANEAVIFRRGPSAWFHVIRWDTLHDVFVPGAWFRGRIYAEKCDLSPNGELLLCFMHQGRKLKTDYSDSWSAISRSPWLHALWLLPQGTTYGGGGKFVDDRSVVLRRYPWFQTEPHPEHPEIGLNISFDADQKDVPIYVSGEDVEGADWSGRDQRGRLIYTTGGLLYLRDEASDEDKRLADFSICAPDPQPAPDFASAPLKVPKKARLRKK